VGCRLVFFARTFTRHDLDVFTLSDNASCYQLVGWMLFFLSLRLQAPPPPSRLWRGFSLTGATFAVQLASYVGLFRVSVFDHQFLVPYFVCSSAPFFIFSNHYISRRLNGEFVNVLVYTTRRKKKRIAGRNCDWMRVVE